MSAIIFGIGFFIGIIFASIYWKRFGKDEEMTVDSCIEYLKSKNIWVKLNVPPDKK